MEAFPAGGCRVGEEFSEPLLFSVGRGDDPDFLILADRLQFLLNPVEHTGETLHAFHRERGRGVEARRGDCGEGHGGQPMHPGEEILRVEQARRDTEPVVQPLCLLGHLVGLDDHPCRACWEQVG